MTDPTRVSAAPDQLPSHGPMRPGPASGPAMGAPLGAIRMPVPGGPGRAAALPPKVAWRYIRRSLALIRPLRGLIIVSTLLGIVVTVLPFVTPAVWGPMVDIMGRVASRDGGSLQNVWNATGPRTSRPDGSISGPVLTFSAWLIIWAAALVLAQVLGFVRAWVDAQVDWRLLTEIRQRVHDHLQSLSLDFFTGARSGALMQRIQVEAGGVVVDGGGFRVPLGGDLAGFGLEVVDLGEQDFHEAVDSFEFGHGVKMP